MWYSYIPPFCHQNINLQVCEPKNVHLEIFIVIRFFEEFNIIK